MNDDNQEAPPYVDEYEVAQNATTNNKSIFNAENKIQSSFLWQKMVAARKKMGEFSAKYPNAVRHAITTSNAVIDFYKRGNPITLLRGGFEIFDTIQAANLYNFHQFAKPTDGFRYLTINKINIAFLFKDTLEGFVKEKLTFKNGETCDIYHLAMGDIYGYQSGDTFYIYFNQNSIDKTKLTKFLVDEKFKDLDSNFLYLQMQEEAYTLSLSSWKPTLLPSAKADEIKGIVKKFNDAGINRSVFLYGAPGVGKTSLSFKLLADLGYRTIVFSASNKLCTFDLIKNLIDLLSIDAVIIDDFDRFNNTDKTLDMLEMFNKKLKVLIGIANSLKDLTPAIYRPGRFDEIILVDELDESCITKVLGKFADQYLDRVRKWPIAFINELAKKGQFLSSKEMEAYANDLEKRVSRQLISEGGKLVKKPLKKEAKAADKKPKREKKVVIDPEMEKAVDAAINALDQLSSLSEEWAIDTRIEQVKINGEMREITFKRDKTGHYLEAFPSDQKPFLLSSDDPISTIKLRLDETNSKIPETTYKEIRDTIETLPALNDA
jgi:ATPase family associated with various cellular activities (AAA)